jgi:hypothetical protein
MSVPLTYYVVIAENAAVLAADMARHWIGLR